MSMRDNSPEGQRNRQKLVNEAFKNWKQSEIKDATFIKAKEGKLWASDYSLKPEHPCWCNDNNCICNGEGNSPCDNCKKAMKDYHQAMEAFNQSFIEVGNPDFALGVLYISDPQKAVQVGDLVTGMQDNLYPISGLQFEVEYQHCIRDTWFALSDHGIMVKYKENDPEYRKVAILSLKQEQPSEEKEEYVTFNLNDRILIQITDKGWQHLQKTAGNDYITHCIKSYEKEINGEKWYSLQAHSVMELLGGAITDSVHVPLLPKIMIPKD